MLVLSDPLVSVSSLLPLCDTAAGGMDGTVVPDTVSEIKTDT